MFRLCGVILAVGLQSALVSAAAFSWTNCSPDDSPVTINYLNVEPNPVDVPGDLFITVNASSAVQLSDTSLALSIKRRTFFGLEIPIPCIGHVGSCTYPDVCHLIDDMETENWAGVSADLGKKIRALLTSVGVDIDACPQPVQQLNINHGQLSLGAIPSVLSFIAAGDYHIHVSAVDTASTKEIVCLDLQATLREKCSGLACLIG